MADSIEGKNPVLELLKSEGTVNKVLIARSSMKDPAIAEIIDLAKRKKIPVEFADKFILDKKSVTKKHQGAIAYTSPKEYADINDLISSIKSRDKKALIVILDGIEDPQNLGAIIRTSEAAGVDGIVIPKRGAAQLTEAVGRASAGAVAHMMIARVSNIAESISKLKDAGVWAVGVEAGQSKKYFDVDFTLPTAIVIGSEGSGLSRLVKERCEILASIPMMGKISSLNASAAAAVVLYEAVRQRNQQM